MKKTTLIILISMITNLISAQKIEISDVDLQTKLDSVLVEGNLLYKYEKAAWLSTDLFMSNRALKKDYAGFLVYEDGNEIKVIVQGQKNQNCISEYVFKENFSKPEIEKNENREYTTKEKYLLEVKAKILDQISDKKYEVTFPGDYSPNFILLPDAEKFKFFIIMGTSQRDIIPFGNDYVFYTDKNGNIENWQKFHSRIIPGYTKMNGQDVIGLTHSHLRTTPLITSTDICTFKLYAPLYGIKDFSVYSPAIGKYMNYNLLENSITIK